MQKASQTIVIHQNALLTRVAVMEDGRLAELHSQWTEQQILHEQIIAAQVDRVLPDIQAAFIDIGQAKNGFLSSRELKPNTQSAIEKNLHPSQKVLVQVIREPNKNKGALLTQNLRFVSGLLVYFPYQTGIRASKKVAEQNQSLDVELQAVLDQHQVGGGFVVRTNAQSATESEIIETAKQLVQRWQAVQQQFKSASPGTVLQGSATVIDRALQNINPSALDTIEVESNELYQELELTIAHGFANLKSKLKLSDNKPILHKHTIPEQFSAALKPVINLESGVRISINHTEAMTVIDIDSAAFLRKTKSEDTLYEINLEAAKAISQQFRLRNIGGIIAIDFIDMPKAEQAERLVAALRSLLQHDRSPCRVLPMSEFGVVEVSRAQIGASLWQLFGQDCMSCGQAQVKSLRAICLEICDAVDLASYKKPNNALTLHISSQLTDKLAELNCLNRYEQNITLKVQKNFKREQFDIVFG